MSMEIVSITGKLEIVTGLHIGAGNAEIHIGGIDSAVIKNPLDGYPYIPGSSLKGKIRSLLELTEGIVTDGNISNRKNTESLIPVVFGDTSQQGMSQVIFRDCFLSKESKQKLQERNILATEEKSENHIDRITGVASDPRNIERVIPGMIFDFEMNLRITDRAKREKILQLIKNGLYLLEHDALGGSGSRGYGKVKFSGLKCDGTDFPVEYDAHEVL